MIRRNSDIEIHLPDAGSPTADTADSSDVEMASPDNQEHMMALPPHIAARFYRRSSSARRACGRKRSPASVSTAPAGVRTSSLTPLQALYFMNGDFPKRCATNLAAHLLSSGSPEKTNIDQAFQIVYGRPASAEEKDRITGFLRTVSDAYTTHGSAPKDSRQKAFADFIQSMFASNEFMFVE